MLPKHAHYRVMWAVKKGKLKRKPCRICGTEKVEAHHEDYSKPLKVLWFCRKHHREYHAAMEKAKHRERDFLRKDLINAVLQESRGT